MYLFIYLFIGYVFTVSKAWIPHNKASIFIKVFFFFCPSGVDRKYEAAVRDGVLSGAAITRAEECTQHVTLPESQ